MGTHEDEYPIVGGRLSDEAEDFQVSLRVASAKVFTVAKASNPGVFLEQRICDHVLVVEQETDRIELVRTQEVEVVID